MDRRTVIYKKYPMGNKTIKQLKRYAKLRENRTKVILASLLTDELLADYLILSAVHQLPYDSPKLAYKDNCLIPCGRSDFYVLKRKFFFIFQCLLNDRKDILQWEL